MKKYIIIFVALITSFNLVQAAHYGHLKLDMLHTAAQNGYLEIIKKLVSKWKIDINAKSDADGFTALMHACSGNHENVVEFLLTVDGIDVNARNFSNCTALIFAAINGYTGIVKRLLQFPNIEINAQDQNRKSALIHSAIVGHRDTAHLLLQADPAAINNQDINGRTPLMHAAIKGNIDVVNLLLSSSAININTKDRNGETALMHAIEHLYENIVQILVAIPSIDINAQDNNGNTALIHAVRSGNENIVKLVLSVPGIDINLKSHFFGSSALIAASYRGHENIVKLLLQCKTSDGKRIVNINDQDKSAGYSALMAASYRGHENIVKLLLEVHDIDINILDDKRNTALMVAIRHGKQNISKLLLQMSGMSNKYRQCDYALLCAAYWGFEDLVKLLMEMPSVYISAKYDNDKITPLVYAQERQNKNIEQLISSKIKELRDKIFEAIKNNDTEAFKAAYRRIGTVVDDNGNTFLHIAFAYNSPDIIAYIFQNAYDPSEPLTATNNSGHVPLELIAPTSDLFKLCMDLAYGTELKLTTLLGSKKRKCETDTIEYAGAKSNDQTNVCANPSCPNPRQHCVERCSRCRDAYYCSAECQKADWKVHKHSCRELIKSS